MKTKIFVLILTIFLVILTSFLFYSKTIFQEGNPLPLLSGIFKLNLTNNQIVQFSIEQNGYITKSKHGKETMTQFMADEGFSLIDQMGSGYIFKNQEGDSKLVTHRYYSKFYDLWFIQIDSTTAKPTVQYPAGYIAKEDGDSLIISGNKGKIIIGGFTPSVGHPIADEGAIVFQSIAYSKDPKSEPGAVPAALYYKNGDINTKDELLKILKTYKK